jgi:hypothetical protein
MWGVKKKKKKPKSWHVEINVEKDINILDMYIF